MPGIDRGTRVCGLVLVGRVPCRVVKFSAGSGSPYEQFANGVTHAVAAVRGPMRVAGIRRFRHPDADEANGHGRGRGLKRTRASLTIRDNAAGESYPTATDWLLDGIFAGPVLDEVAPCVRIGPGNANGVDRLRRSQI